MALSKKLILKITKISIHFLKSIFRFGGGPACSELHYCIPCQKSYLHLRCKRENELKMVKEIKRRVRMTSRSFPHLTYDYYLPPNAISKAWMDKWRDFIKSESIGYFFFNFNLFD